MDEIKRLKATIKAQSHIIAGQDKLLVCYRLGTRSGLCGAIDKIEKGKRQLAKLSEKEEDTQ